jgi:glycosyltransferase involved in cell wall biosynthesis
MPRVSVGVPVYNGERYLAETLASLRAQTLQDLEIVISDNASTDRTPDICRGFQAMDPRVRYFRNDRNIGAAANFNRVFELSTAPLFHGGACDDLYDPRFLERCVDALDRHPDAVLSHARTRMIGERGEPLPFDPERNCYIGSYGDVQGASGDVIRPQPLRVAEAASPASRFRDVLWRMGAAWPLSGVIRSEALRRTALYGLYSGADKVLLAELALLGRFHEIGEELFAKRMHRGCSHYMSTKERAIHEVKGAGRIPQLEMIKDYTRMVRAADLGMLQRLHCMVTIVGMARHPHVWRRLLVPGPDNYLGWSLAGTWPRRARRMTPAGRADADRAGSRP